MKLLRSVTVLLSSLALSSCEKNAVQDITGTLPRAAVRFFNFGVNAPSVNFYANATKMSAILSATGVESTLGVAYGGVSAGGAYSAVDPAQYTLTGKISADVDKDLAVSTVSATLADGKLYSYYMSGIYNTTTKTVDAFVVEDALPPGAFDFTQAYVRFVNAISNAAPMTLYARNTTTSTEAAIGAEVPYKGAGAFVPVAGGVYDIGTRVAGVATNAISRAAVSFVPGRIYTITSRGDITVVSTTAANRPILDNTGNR
jgi:hypothetical protein